MPTPNNHQDAIDFFRGLGIEPIVIDPNDEKSIEKGLNEVTERIASKDDDEKNNTK
jgi:effector-binding domain-containing protein